jgi:hypothetical protein
MAPRRKALYRALLLPACDPDIVTRWLPEFGYAVTAWGLFGRHHPGAVLDAVGRDLADGIFFGRVWRRSGWMRFRRSKV